ncbi:hypothetical protein [Pelagerythrobacter marinus]|uniref:hypothetical protein n=1 Tax=Pelagerythrobacter marinus TaxID=538382 RepID=UPI002036816B|nr:hypothetical protein [Pelagerythrobacter marinus]USA39041.1 hypothetical protein NCF86_12130 [Pelagerythrobacter marinus]WPZ06873.1 hypothetical protein T8T98_15975 [Pelagerythrobacter marinus]
MEIDVLLQLGASALAIPALAALAHRLGLGGEPRIRDAAHARALAEEAIDGFDAQDIALDRAGQAALVRGGDGRVLLLRRHGARFAGRLVTGHGDVRLDRDLLFVATADRRFGSVALDLGPAAPRWAASLRRL